MIKKIFNKSISLALVAFLAISGTITSFGNSNFSAVYADEESKAVSTENTELDAGTYVAALYRNSEYTDSLSSYNSMNKFYGQALLTINEDGTQSITIGVQNWSFYEAFITLKQTYTDVVNHGSGSTVYVPEKLFDDCELTKESSFNSKYIISNGTTTKSDIEKLDGVNINEECYNYDYEKTESDATYENIEYDSKLDVAYLTIPVESYEKPIWLLSWFSVPTSVLTARVQSYYSSSFIWLNTDTLISVSKLKTAISQGTAKYSIRQGTFDSSNHYNISYSGEDAVHALFSASNNNFSAAANNDDTYTAKFYINNYDNYSDGYGAPTNFKLVSGKDYSSYTNLTYEAWHTYPGNNTKPTSADNQTTFTALEVKTDDKGSYIEITYTERELIFGKYLWYNSKKTSDGSDKSFFCMPCISLSESIKPISLEYLDEETGTVFKIDTNTSKLPSGTEINVTKNDKKYNYGYTSLAYDESNWYTIAFKDKSGNAVEPSGRVNLTISLPNNFTETGSYAEYRSIDGVFIKNNKMCSNEIDYDTNTWTKTNTLINGYTFFIGHLSSTVDMEDDNISDGIYSVNIFFNKADYKGTMSMANDALDHEAYIVRKDGINTLYFKAHSMNLDGVDCYIGDLYCNTVEGNEVLYDNTSYTSYETDSEGNLLNNSGYNAVTEWACITGGIITLDKSCYLEENNVYVIAVSSPVMAALGGSNYEEVNANDLIVWLSFSNLVKKEDMTNESVKALFPYTKSALHREIELSKTYDEELYVTETWNNLQYALDIAQTVYDNKDAASNEIEKQINLVKAAREDLAVDQSAVGDKTELQALVKQAEAITADDYTNSSYSALQTAIKAAANTLAKEAVKQSKLDEQVSALQSVIDALEKKPETTLDKDNLPDGKYTLYAEMIKTDRASYSMSNNGINHTVQLDVADGQYYITVQFKGLAIYNQFGYLQNLGYYDTGYSYSDFGVPQGTVIPAEVLSNYDVVDQYNNADNLYPELLKFKLVDKASEQYVPLQVFVPIMEAISKGTGTQDVLMQLDWSTLVSTDKDIEPEPPAEQSPAVDYTDSKTGVKIHADKGVFEKGIKISVTEIKTGTDYNKASSVLSDAGSKFKLYDIKFADANGKETAPNGTVSISLPIVNGYNSANIAVYRINSDGSKTLIKGSVSNGYYTIITKRAGKYALIDKSSTVKTTASTKATRSASDVAKDKKAAKKLMKQAKIKKLTVKSKANKKITVTWKKVKKAKGYEVQVSANKKFKKNKIVLSKFSKKKKLTIKSKIKSGKTYYVRVRAYAEYKNKNNKAIKVYSAWNKKLRKVTVK